MNKIARYHALERTSPKGPGMPFIGTCIQCGRTGLSVSAIQEECDNIRGNTEGESLIEVIDPRTLAEHLADEPMSTAERQRHIRGHAARKSKP